MNIMKTKKFLGFVLITTILLSLSSCYTTGYGHRRMPPGQAKKVYGGKSAKRYAPGQQKKKKVKKNKKYQNLFP